jgi:1-acyl-sn-glycerol-3-phosphate acyltransferase
VEQGRQRLKAGRWVVIFPEGTRTAPGERGRYRIGGALLAERSGAPVVPMAHNAGEFWPRLGFIKRPGVITVRIGPVIDPAGKSAQEILKQTEDWIETTMAEITSRPELYPPR